MNEIKKLNLSSYVKLLDQNQDITSVMNGLDIFVQSSSYGEDFLMLLLRLWLVGHHVL